MDTDIQYQSGFGNQFSSEAISGSLPHRGNNPQKPPHGLYAEQLSGSAFTAPNAENQRSWFYRILPSVTHLPFAEYKHAHWISTTGDLRPTPNQLRWDAPEFPSEKTDFIDGIRTMCVNGSPEAQSGSAVHIYVANQSMNDRAFYNSDGDLLIVPQLGELSVKTEFGLLTVAPGEICVIQRGIKFQVLLESAEARGYLCENFGAHFQIPYRGPIGANGLANERDFLTPVAFYEEKKSDYELITRFGGSLYIAKIDHSPFDVVAWHGNYAPYKYDLSLYNTMNTVSFDHPDPSIFTVLTSPSGKAGTANVDFVIFPPRWMVAEDTFRPPYYHRNIMSEFMGLITGVYDAKPGGFVPGGSSLHNCMSAHGPDKNAFEHGTKAKLENERYKDTMAFMFESCWVYQPTKFAMTDKSLQNDYYQCWQDLEPHFKK